MSLKTWRNKDKADIVKAIIEHNFRVLGQNLSKNMLSLTTEERNALTSDYRSNGLIVYDKTESKWYQFDSESGKWSPYNIGKPYVLTFEASDWNDNTIRIPFAEHSIPNPDVNLYILLEGKYHPALGGIEIDTEYNVTISVDMSFDGKVVIK